jgi:hypothetical protein
LAIKRIVVGDDAAATPASSQAEAKRIDDAMPSALHKVFTADSLVEFHASCMAELGVFQHRASRTMIHDRPRPGAFQGGPVKESLGGDQRGGGPRS